MNTLTKLKIWVPTLAGLATIIASGYSVVSDISDTKAKNAELQFILESYDKQLEHLYLVVEGAKPGSFASKTVSSNSKGKPVIKWPWKKASKTKSIKDETHTRPSFQQLQQQHYRQQTQQQK